MNKLDTLVDVLVERSHSWNGRGIRFIYPGGHEGLLSYPDLYTAAMRTLGYLQYNGVCAGDELVIQVSDNKDLVVFFWAAVIGGIIPVPLSTAKNDEQRKKVFNVWQQLRRPWLASTTELLTGLNVYFQSRKQFSNGIRDISSSFIDVSVAASFINQGLPVELLPEDIAFIQFSSGSTGDPKGVILTHSNLLVNIPDISHAAGYTEADRMLSWMPLTHDMGLIGFHLNPLYNNIDHCIIPTDIFIRRPEIWMDKASEQAATILCSPNFGYKYFLKNRKAGRACNWDLSAIRIIYNGAEPISRKLIDSFSTSLLPYGLDPNAVRPVYGLAEASLAVTISTPGTAVASVLADRNRLNISDPVLLLPAAEERGAEFVNVGYPISHCAVRIVDGQDRVLEELVVGRIQIKGENVTAGYYQKDRKLKGSSAADWLDTGDTGFFKEGALYVIGRTKDILLVNGYNYYPHDLEQALDSLEGVELNKVAVAGYFDENLSRDLICVFILNRSRSGEFEELAGRVRNFVNLHFGIEIDKVIPVKEIPKTTSGKLQRFKLLEEYRNSCNDTADAMVSERHPENLPESAGGNDSLEEIILRVWRAITGTGNLSRQHDFFANGGNSLKAAEAEGRLSEILGVEIPLYILYRHPTAEQLAAEILRSQHPSFSPIISRVTNERYPLSSFQRRMYYMWQADKSSIAGNMPVAFSVEGTVDTLLLERCIKVIISRHTILRSVFRAGAIPEMQTIPDFSWTLTYNECTKDRLAFYLQALVKPFDLIEGPLFRLELIRTDDARHVFFMDFHHSIADGVSVMNLLKELDQLYKGEELAVPSLQYSDFTYWQQEHHLSPERMNDLDNYWRKELAYPLPVLDLPIDHPRPAIFNTNGSRLNYLISAELAQALKQLAEQEQCTLHILLFTIYRMLLCKYTGQDDIIIGIPVAGRTFPGLHSMQGAFVNNLAIRTRINGDEDFRDILALCKGKIRDAFVHGDYLFENAIDLCGNRDMSRNVVFDNMFVYQNMQIPGIDDETFKMQRHHFDAGYSRYDLTVEMFETPEDLSYVIEYNTSLFEKDTILRLSDHFMELIRQLTDDPSRSLTQYKLLTSVQEELIRTTFNDTQVIYPDRSSVCKLFEEQAALVPDKVAIEFNKNDITYCVLNRHAHDLAVRLKNFFGRAKTVIAIMLPNSPELVFSILAAFKAGYIYVPVDPDLPPNRIQFMIEDSGSSILISSIRLKDRVAAIGCKVGILFVEEAGANERPAVMPEGSSEMAVTEEAYIIYTSGTTGNPKGVVVGHRSLVNYTRWAASQYLEGEDQAFALFTSISFDLTVTSVFTPLITGNRIVIYEMPDKAELLDRILTDDRVTTIKLTPSHLRLLRSGFTKKSNGESRLKTLIVGGENLTVALAKEVYEMYNGKVTIFNEYGPTEATVGCMIHRFDPMDDVVNVPIGTPAANTRVYVLDKFRQPLTEGIRGELYVAGDCLAIGYLGREELTLQKFLPDQYMSSEKMYRTGDWAKRSAKGYIEYLGRQDEQIKINGYRVEIGEIEHVLQRISGIENCVVTTGRDGRERECLCGYYTGKEDIREERIKKILAEQLPYWMVPERFQRLNKIPLTVNGKVDKARLPDIFPDLLPDINELPPDSIEAVCKTVWGEVLGNSKISVTDNFYALGGDSIRAVQISARLKEKKIRLTARDILTFHTIAQCASVASFEQAEPRRESVLSGTMPMTPITRWFVGQNFEMPGCYNQSVLLKLKRPVSKEILAHAFTLLVAAHDTLRLNYDSARQELFYNENHKGAKVLLRACKVTDISRLPGKTYRIGDELLIDVLLIKYKAEDFMLFRAHHLVVDGVSWRILLEDLRNIIISLEKKENWQPFQTASFSDWSTSLHQQATTAPEIHLPRNPACAADFRVPLDMQNPEWYMRRAAKETGRLNKERTHFLLHKSHAVYGTDIRILLQLSLVRTLKEWTGSNRCVVQEEWHGRPDGDEDLSRTVGWFTLMYPLSITLSPAGLEAQIKSVKEQMRIDVSDQDMRAYTSMLTGIDELRFNYLGVFGEEMKNDLFEYQGRGAWNVDHHPENNMTAKLEFNAMVIDGELLVELIYNDSAHKKTTAVWLTNTFFDNLEKILEHIAGQNERHFTPSDFDMAGLEQTDLDELFY